MGSKSIDLAYLKTIDAAYYISFVFLMFIVWSDLMIFRLPLVSNVYVSLVISVVASFYVTRWMLEKKFYD